MRIVIDAGHGPNTPGKRSPDGMREYEFNSAVANAMRTELERYEGVSVVFTHELTRDVPLKERTDKANKLSVDLFVSLHADALNGVMGVHGGITTFVYDKSTPSALKLAETIQQNLIAATGLRNRGVKTADFHVLRETKMPAVLIEHGFMDSTTDLPRLKDVSYRTLCGVTNAKSIAEVYGLKLKAVVVEVANETDKQAVELADKFAREAQEWAIANGVSDGSNPKAPVTRQEIWTMLWRMATKKGAK